MDTTTPDSADTGIAETSADSLNSASEVSNDDIDNAQAESNVKDSDTEDTTAKDQRSKKTNSRKHKKPQKPNKIKASLARLNQFIKASAAPILTSKFAQLLISAAVALHKLWKKRPKCPYTLYVVVMALIDAAAVTFIQWGMYSEPKYDDPNAVDSTTKILNSVNGQLTRFVTQMWLEEDKLNWLLNFLALGMVYLVLVFVINRFWVATAVFAITMSVYAVANSIKIILRNEPILPSDLSFLSSGNGGEITSFIPKSSQALVDGTITMLIWLTVICLILQFVDGRRCVIPFHWWRPFRNVKTIIGNVTRIIAAAMSITLLCSFTWTLSIPGAWGYEWAKSWGDAPQLWNAEGDAANNGPIINFLRLTHPKIMDKPEGYSQETMEELAKKYSSEANQINGTRANNLTDNTVIMILSESFSDPTRVPGIALAEDPMPNIRALKETTTSGLMLSPGFGGGTANIEYQSLTGLDLALFDDSMQSMYQELVPHQKNPFAWNQIWNAEYGKSGSVAFHSYYKNMYLRDVNYKKFGFNKFYTLDSKPAITNQDRIDNSPYVSDAASYQNIIDQINKEKHPQFLQLVTMQNHMPYDNWYFNNQFEQANVTENLNDYERGQINTYAKGVSITDQATIDFLNQLNAMDKPITVIFYGDHLPGSYQTAAADKNNTLALHQTDYFIWSNQASASAGVKLDASNTAYTSPNYFMEMAAEHMNAKVSPYLAFLTQTRTDIPALERLVIGAGGAYLDQNGNAIKRKALSKQAKNTLHDYKLIQYDMTAGKGYLNGTNFFTVK
ncbi:LTA synthase family protein [Bifidobacterium longum]|uniref:LTA synthase family protein n=1 Tax=Bifidobacterium longum TaxID=216816 RepID=UPI0022AFE7C9|nr:LTA synthase family protein [Bifidobacterium longum]MCZ4462078.1 LTA synthase family protein [Bifidobacterium longum subsp. longum]MCZ4463934.1 LTA synthase family protein [Bifidobacterium longum subsp. longum]